MNYVIRSILHIIGENLERLLSIPTHFILLEEVRVERAAGFFFCFLFLSFLLYFLPGVISELCVWRNKDGLREL